MSESSKPYSPSLSHAALTDMKIRGVQMRNLPVISFPMGWVELLPEK